MKVRTANISTKQHTGYRKGIFQITALRRVRSETRTINILNDNEHNESIDNNYKPEFKLQ